MKYGTGALETGYDIRQFWYTPTDKGAFDWKKGFFLDVPIVVKDQNGSGSCGGQAWSYYGEVLEKVATGTYEPRSARWIYSHTRVPTGGSNGHVNCDFVVKNGWALEALVPSYDNGKAPDEEFMSIVPEKTNEIIEDTEVTKATSYLRIEPNMELFAQAIQDNYGLVMVVNGQDNGTWRTKYPKPPTVKEWGHFVYAVGAVTVNGKKYIKIINSWGDDVGDKGYQYIGEDYFASGHVREGWTLAWDYQAPKHKLLLIQVVKLLTQLVGLLTKKK